MYQEACLDVNLCDGWHNYLLFFCNQMVNLGSTDQVAGAAKHKESISLCTNFSKDLLRYC